MTQITEQGEFAPSGASSRARNAWERSLRAARVGELAWWGFVAFMVTWVASYVQWPFSNDQGNLAWVGDAIVSGGFAYRDAWDVKGPFTHYMFALVQLLFGRNQWGLRVFDVLVVLVGAVCISRLVRPYAGTVARRCAVALYALWYASLGHHHTAQPDGWAGVILAIAALTLLARVAIPSVLRHALCGALIGLCILVKPTYATFLAVPVLHAIATLRRTALRRTGAEIATSVVGAAVPVALCAWLFQANGALDDLMDVQFGWILTSYADVDSALLSRVRTAVGLLTSREVAVALPLALAATAVVWRRNRAAAAVLAAWTAAAALNVTAQGAFYAYHWHPLYAPLAVLTGIGLDGLFQMWMEARAEPDIRGRPTFRRTLAVAVAVVIFAGAANEPAGHFFRWATTVAGLRDRDVYDRTEFGPYGRDAGELDDVARYVAARSREGEGLLVWGLVAGVNYLGNRPSPSRFGYVQPLVDPPDTELRSRYRREFFTRLGANPPLYVVSLNEETCASRPSSEARKLLGPAEGVVRCLNDIPELHDFVLTHYVVEERIGPLEIRRVASARRAQP